MLINNLTPAGHYRLAVALLCLSYVNYSFGSLLVRSLESALPWQILFWRAAALGLLISMVLLVRHGTTLVVEFRSLTRWGFIAGLVNGVSPAGYIFALHLTTVANTVFILATVPFITAVLARVFLRERLTAAMLIAMPVAFVGLAIMFGVGVSGGAGLGNVVALMTAISFSGSTRICVG